MNLKYHQEGETVILVVDDRHSRIFQAHIRPLENLVMVQYLSDFLPSHEAAIIGKAFLFASMIANGTLAVGPTMTVVDAEIVNIAS